MENSFLSLIKKDFRMMISGRFFLLALGSLILYSCYINLVYVKTDQDIYPVYLFDPAGKQRNPSAEVISVNSKEELQKVCLDGYAVGIDASGDTTEIIMVSSGSSKSDHHRGAYAQSLLWNTGESRALVMGNNNKEMKNRREITSEFLFFELTAVGFLGVASTLFKEKQMGVIRVHSILPVSKAAFIGSKLLLFFLSDLLFAVLLTIINLGIPSALAVMPDVLLQVGILSTIMSLTGFLCAVWIPDFKQFSLLYLVLAIFITIPVFLAGQTSVSWGWINFHPMYHLFMAMKNAYFGTPGSNSIYFLVCIAVIGFLFYFARRVLSREMAKEG